LEIKKGSWSVRERKSLGEKERPCTALEPALHWHCTALAPALPLFFLPNITIEKASKIRRKADLAGRGKNSKI